MCTGSKEKQKKSKIRKVGITAQDQTLARFFRFCKFFARLPSMPFDKHNVNKKSEHLCRFDDLLNVLPSCDEEHLNDNGELNFVDIDTPHVIL
jgi:hypothetical protein